MGWESSNRKNRLPKNWYSLRTKVLQRAHHVCEYVDNGVRCVAYANEVDHIIAGDDHSLDNLQALCSFHHSRKSSQEGNAARKQKYSKRIEPHPGYIENEKD